MSALPPRYPMEIAFPDITPFAAGSGGVPYVHTFDSGNPGPRVMINSLTHGNEVCGAVAVSELLNHGLRPRRGRITLSFANIDAYRAFREDDPDASRFVDEDFNRVWSTRALEDARRNSCEMARARQLRPIVDTVDLLLDIHSMHEKSLPLSLSGPLEKGVRLASDVACPPTVIVDRGHVEGKRLRDYGDFGSPGSTRNALLVECGQHFEKSAVTVARQSAASFLYEAGVVGAEDMPGGWLNAAKSEVDIIDVTGAVVARTMNFRFAGDYTGLETFAERGTVVAWDDGEAVVTPHADCVLVMPSLRQLRPGVTVVRFGRRRG